MAGRYKSPKELAGKRVVTSFPNLTRKYFEPLDAELGVTTNIRSAASSFNRSIFFFPLSTG